MTWECFYDNSYYGMWAVRHIGRTGFGEAVHVRTQEEAEFLVKELNEKDELETEWTALRAKIGDNCCACSFERPDDVCMAHSPLLNKALSEREKLVKALKKIAAYQHVPTCRFFNTISVYECICNETPEPRKIAKNILKKLGIEE